MKRYIANRIIFILAVFVVYFLQFLIMAKIFDFAYMLLIVQFFLLVVIIACGIYFIYLPYKKYSRSLKLFLQDYIFDDFFNLKIRFSKPEEEILNKFYKTVNMASILNDSVKHGHYLALQNQINPHFLYNTLEAIRGEAIVSGMENVEKMTEALSTFFRYTISSVENLVTFNEELKNVNDYFLIQKYRFDDRLDLVVHIDEVDKEEIQKYKLPKLILQPIVENCVQHGLERKLGKGIVEISVHMTNTRLVIKISDDGIGIDDKNLAKLNKMLGKFMSETSFEPFGNENKKTKGGIALVNVNTRIKLLYGEDYGLRYESVLGSGTDAIIELPRYSKNVGV